MDKIDSGTFAARIRPAIEGDIPVLLPLMKGLARFEGYLDHFDVTDAELRRRGFPKEGEPEFFALLAEGESGEPVAYLVYYLVPFTFDLKATMILKELYVLERHRGRGLATKLLNRLDAVAKEAGCGRIRWSVLPDNGGAKALYRHWGARPDNSWEHWLKECPVASDQATLVTAGS